MQLTIFLYGVRFMISSVSLFIWWFFRASLLRQFCLSVSIDTFLHCVKKVKRITNTFRRLVAVSSTFY